MKRNFNFPRKKPKLSKKNSFIGQPDLTEEDKKQKRGT